MPERINLPIGRSPRHLQVWRLLLVQIKTRFGLPRSRFGEIVNGLRRQNKERRAFPSSLPTDPAIHAASSSHRLVTSSPQARVRASARSMPLEILHGALVLLRRRARREGAEIAPPPGPRIFLARIEPVLAGRRACGSWRMLRTRFVYRKATVCILFRGHAPVHPRSAHLRARAPGHATTKSHGRKKGSGAPRGASNHGGIIRMPLRIQRDALAFRRSTAALVVGSRHHSASGRASLFGGSLPRPRPRHAGLRTLAAAKFSQTPGRPVVMPAGSMPEAARERSANPRAGAAPAPHSGMPSGKRPLRERDDSLCNRNGDNCQCNSDDKFQSGHSICIELLSMSGSLQTSSPSLVIVQP